ncbi:MAG: hypothetical protein FE834_06340 [Gammaproteobacteria bacterium]|nr:hypothetical protein [Gammaproteobacteria bacterium]
MKKITLILTLAVTIAFSSSGVFAKTTIGLYNYMPNISGGQSCQEQYFESLEAIPSGAAIIKDGKCKVQPACLTFKGLEYCAIMSPDTGRFWLDRNLGASRVCASFDDADCYGNYYQWGRNDDGHELPTSGTTTTLLSTITTESDKFVVSALGLDWLQDAARIIDQADGGRANGWADSSNGGINDICPAGFSVPTEDELRADTTHSEEGNTSEGANDIINTATAFSSFLKIPAAGYRSSDMSAAIKISGSAAYVRSRSQFQGHYRPYKQNLFLLAGANYADISGEQSNLWGYSVRCIKD